MKIEVLNEGGLTCFKGTATLIDEKELETFDNNIHRVAEEYCKITFKEKDHILTQRLIKKQEEEIERLNNNWNKLENYIEDKRDYYDNQNCAYYMFNQVLEYLKELKGSDK